MHHTETNIPRGNRLRQAASKLAVIGLLGALASGCAATSAEAPTAQPSHKVVAAIEAAQRYNCKVVSLEDTGATPVVGGDYLPDVEKRTTVEVAVETSDTEAAKPFLEEYADGTPKAAEVQWMHPVVSGKIMEDGQYVTQMGVNTIAVNSEHQQDTNPYDPGIIHGQLYPRTDYADGTVAELYVRNFAMTWDENNAYDTSALMPCGTMVLRGGTWHVGQLELPDAPRLSDITTTPLNK